MKIFQSMGDFTKHRNAREAVNGMFISQPWACRR